MTGDEVDASPKKILRSIKLNKSIMYYCTYTPHLSRESWPKLKNLTLPQAYHI